MELKGASAPLAHPLADEAGDVIVSGRPCLLWSDGEDVVFIAGDAGDDAGDVLKMGARMLPEFRE